MNFPTAINCGRSGNKIIEKRAKTKHLVGKVQDASSFGYFSPKEKYLSVAQLDSASDSDSEGHEFESHQTGQSRAS